MTSLLALPDDDSGGRPSRHHMAKVRRTEMRLFDHTLEAHTIAEIDRLDSQAIADASRAALEAEVGLMEYGLARAQGSFAKTELVARHVERMAAINDRRITRRFG
jgi:hypothetical protein